MPPTSCGAAARSTPRPRHRVWPPTGCTSTAPSPTPAAPARSPSAARRRHASPFLREPRLLPRLVRFLNRHPALSYLYSHDFVGSSGQSVRADERGMDAIDELDLTLDLLERSEKLSPELLWHSLAPFLCDASGNSHRAEMNIEKLWNPFLAGRGRQGLVEFRALRMQHTPQRATALACLLRAIVAMLAGEASAPPLIDWGRELHERFALPFYLEQDLHAVLQELAAPDWASTRRSRRCSCATNSASGDRSRCLAADWKYDAPSSSGHCSATPPAPSRAAVPAWSTPARRASNCACGLPKRTLPAGMTGRSVAAGVALPLRRECDGRGELAVFGLRYRSFVPGWGLHPALPAQAPLRLRLRHPEQAADHLVTLHEWRPDGEGYAGLPADLAAAAARRAERVTLEVLPRDPSTPERPAPVAGLGAYCLDLRCLPG
jgi:hypothetical protein